jgi:hypothetical protein
MAGWIAIASANHVARGSAGGFMQVCHGKRAPLARVQPGDHVFYYSPRTDMGGGERLMSFTAAGIAWSGPPYLFDMGSGFEPYRRDVDWFSTKHTPIGPLLGVLDLTRGQPNWGHVFRFGLVKISDHDCAVIAAAMDVGQTASE